VQTKQNKGIITTDSGFHLMIDSMARMGHQTSKSPKRRGVIE
jgi:hypothetical protein